LAKDLSKTRISRFEDKTKPQNRLKRRGGKPPPSGPPAGSCDRNATGKKRCGDSGVPTNATVDFVAPKVLMKGPARQGAPTSLRKPTIICLGAA
jgi:hypothetical protein